MIDAKDKILGEFLMGELIGKNVEIKKSIRRELVGLKGKIIDETLNTFLIEVKKKEKKIPKVLCVFRFCVDHNYRDIDGRDLVYRPEDRIKKYWRTFNGAMRGQKLSKTREIKNKRKRA